MREKLVCQTDIVQHQVLQSECVGGDGPGDLLPDLSVAPPVPELQHGDLLVLLAHQLPQLQLGEVQSGDPGPPASVALQQEISREVQWTIREVLSLIQF